MEDIKNIDVFKSTVVKAELGILTTLVADIGATVYDTISFDEKILLANQIYSEDGTYNIVYTVINNDGEQDSFLESEGLSPTLFLNPNNEVYVFISPKLSDKDEEISLPIFNRMKTDSSKASRPIECEFVGATKLASIFYKASWAKTKPDKLLAIEFKNSSIKKKHNSKIPLPSGNKIFIDNDEIHLLAKDSNGWLHRQIDEQGNIIRERVISTDTQNFQQILSLSFEKESYIRYGKNREILVEIISADGKCKSKDLANIQDVFYSSMQPVKIANNTYVTHFIGEFGRGWFTIKRDQLLELFYSKGENGYKNLMTGEVLPMENENMAIAGIHKTTDNGYAIVFETKTIRPRNQNKELIILNRKLS